MDKILELGFKEAAEVISENSSITIRIEENELAKNILYSFIIEIGDEISDWNVMYIGHTRKSFKNRMYGYQQGNGNGVNNRVHNEVKKLLAEGRKIKVYILNDVFNLNIHSLSIDFAAGLEYSLIEYYNQYNFNNNHPPLQNIAGNNNYNNKINNSELNTLEINAVVEENEIYIDESSDYSKTKGVFDYKLGKTYWDNPFINIPVKYSDLFGGQDSAVKVDFIKNNQLIKSIIVLVNRNAVANKAPRLYFGKTEEGDWFQSWKHMNFREGDSTLIYILGKNHIVFKLD
jgi:hypothetical protein